jgi:ABC-type transporter Mla subunit MlaD
MVMSLFGNVPADALVDAVEKHVATLDDDDLAALLRGGLQSMPPLAIDALVQSILDAFRERGESSEDAAEGAEAPLAAIEARDPAAVGALVSYARANAGLLEDALARFAQDYRDQLADLPAPLVRGIAGAL